MIMVSPILPSLPEVRLKAVDREVVYAWVEQMDRLKNSFSFNQSSYQQRNYELLQRAHSIVYDAAKSKTTQPFEVAYLTRLVEILDFAAAAMPRSERLRYALSQEDTAWPRAVAGRSVGGAGRRQLAFAGDCAMPSDVKAVLSAIALVVGAVLAFWSGSPIRPGFSTFVIGTTIFMVAAMWIFPEAGVKKGQVKRTK